MKTIENIDDKIAHFQDDISEDDKAKLPTFRKMFKAALGMSAAENKEEAIDMYQVGLKLSIDGANINLEDAEFNLLKKACRNNPARWIAHFYAQVVLKLDNSEKKAGS